MLHLSYSRDAIVPTQPLLRLVSAEQKEVGGVFGRHEIAVMTAAFEGILRDLNLIDRDDPLVTMIAKLVIELVRDGERDPAELRKQVLGRHAPAS